MLVFENDYSEGAHELILRRLLQTNDEPLSGYGSDPYTKAAARKIAAACHCPDAEVYLLCGGTQTNAVVIGSLLRRYEGVIAAASGHISVHEAGAIEYTGHKVLALPHHEGKLDADELKRFLDEHEADGNREHMVFPGMVYLSHPTEYGTLYTRKQLKAIASVCHEAGLLLYVDGARLGYALASADNDITLADLAAFCDVFYIGGTKVGALCGEALVFPAGAPPHFLTMVKQQGALLAKGRLLGVQFDALFTDELYVRLGSNAILMARKLADGFRAKGYAFFIPPQTNQLFVILTDEQQRHLARFVRFSFWEKLDDTHTVVRFATSWATKEEDVEQLIQLL